MAFWRWISKHRTDSSRLDILSFCIPSLTFQGSITKSRQLPVCKPEDKGGTTAEFFEKKVRSQKQTLHKVGSRRTAALQRVTRMWKFETLIFVRLAVVFRASPVNSVGLLQKVRRDNIASSDIFKFLAPHQNEVRQRNPIPPVQKQSYV